MTLCLMKDNNKITLRKYINIFTEAEWTIRKTFRIKSEERKGRKLFSKRFGNEK